VGGWAVHLGLFRAAQLLARLRWILAIASTCLAVSAGMWWGAIAGQPGTGHPDKAASAEDIGVSERIKRVRAELDNQVRPETTPLSRWLLAQWYNFGNFRPVPQYHYLPQAPMPQGVVPPLLRPPQLPPMRAYPGRFPARPPMWRNF
jgi:hypothetical protein